MGFAHNIRFDEQVRVLETDGHQAARLVELGDFFVLDGEHVLRNLYDDADWHAPSNNCAPTLG